MTEPEWEFREFFAAEYGRLRGPGAIPDGPDRLALQPAGLYRPVQALGAQGGGVGGVGGAGGPAGRIVG